MCLHRWHLGTNTMPRGANDSSTSYMVLLSSSILWISYYDDMGLDKVVWLVVFMCWVLECRFLR